MAIPQLEQVLKENEAMKRKLQKLFDERQEREIKKRMDEDQERMNAVMWSTWDYEG